MKFILTNKEEGFFDVNNPISKDDLVKIDGLDIPREPNLSPVSLGEYGVEWQTLAPKRKKEVLIQNKEQLLGTLKSDILYVIDGDIALGDGEYIEVPESGLNIMGYSFDASRIGSYGTTNHTIFKSGAGGSGNLIIHNIAFTTTGEGSKVFDIKDRDGSHALEMVTVNFEGCTSIGEIDGYRQGTGITIGFYGCDDGLTFSGAWNGFKLTNTNSFGFGENGVMFREGTDLTFRNRFFLEVNVDLPVGAELCNFSPSNFLENNLLQINTTLAKLGGTIDAETNTPLLFPNINPEDVEALFIDNIGLINTKYENYYTKEEIDDIIGGGTGLTSSDESLLINNEIGDIKVNTEGWDLAQEYKNQLNF